MWINRAAYTETMMRNAHYIGENKTLAEQLVSQKVTMDWLMVRLTQLEHERAQLIFNYMGVKITTPQFEPERAPIGGEAISDIPSFDDVGDEKAKEMGLNWDSDGRLTQHGKAIGA